MWIKGGEHALNRGLSCLLVVDVTGIPVGDGFNGFLVISLDIIGFGI